MIKLDVSDFGRVSKWLDGVADQLPFAYSLALNRATRAAMTTLVDDVWPTHVKVKNKSFLKFAFGRAKFSTKRDLSVEINDERAQGRGRLSLHDKGGTKRNARGGNLAVPSADLQRRSNSKGIPKAYRPKNLPNSFRKGDVIYQRQGKKGRKLKLMYVIKKQVPIHADVPFTASFDRTVRTQAKLLFPECLNEALRTARR